MLCVFHNAYMCTPCDTHITSFSGPYTHIPTHPTSPSIPSPFPPTLRFDLLHVMVDEPNDIHDFAIATHIVNVHRDGSAALNVPYDMGQMQRYIKFARTYKPEITSEAARMLVESYKHLRADDAVPGSNTSYRITVRQLEALIRLSQALARVRCSDRVNTAHVKEVRVRGGERKNVGGGG